MIRHAALALLLLVLAPAPCLSQDKYFDAGGVRLRYIERGAGEPIVLVHGFTNTAEIWESNAFNVATLSVAVRTIRTLVATSSLPA